MAEKPDLIIHKAGKPTEALVKNGKLRFLVDSANTHGAWSLVEITENPGYKTQVHRHNTWDESFYILEGTLTILIADTTHELTAGSYILIPRGMPHAQGNAGTVPVRMLLTMRPSGFERHLKDRVQLFKVVDPNSPAFEKGMDSLRRKNAVYIENLRPWELPKKSAMVK